MHRFFAIASAVAVVAGTSSLASAASLLTDNFSTSTLDGTPSPTSTSTSYDVASTKNSTRTIGSGSLKMSLAATTSGLVEAQSKFTGATLGTAGDYVELTTTFKPTGLFNGTSNGDSLYLGFYNSAGTNPATGLASSGLSTTAGSSFATGNAANWQGYVGQITNNAAGGNVNDRVVTRPLQNGSGTTSANQELLANAAGGGTYTNPAGVIVGTTTTNTPVLTLTDGSLYTLTLRITRGVAGDQTFLYTLADSTNTTLITNSTSAASPLTNVYDGFAIGYRHAIPTTGTASAIDYNSLSITASIAPVVNAPEPAALAAIAGVGGVLLRRRRAAR